ncbi:hypothetical protein JF540_22945 [Salipiger thiooxidans]|uniref:hypothetical protein n=1 Tax=Salipiger thiooxidans TaxID=282683 RepID=UPI001A8F4307|nr:hypothetical protein [Salipiger thiooxidans]MBN8189547.1 hypothetical protein [Salipiger thiooxidans]
MNMLDRRAFFKSAPVAALAATATPALAFQAPVTETPEPDPIRRWLEQWKAHRAEWETNGHDETGEETAYGAAAWDEASKLGDKIAGTKAITQDGALAQVEFILLDSEPSDFNVTGHREALKLVAAALKGGLV